MCKIAASIMCANQLNLKEELRKLELAGIELLHCDVMDGRFVNNLAMGPYVLQEIKQNTNIPLDIHLATMTPGKYIEMFASIKPKYISFHIEATEDAYEEIRILNNYGINPVLAISPETSVKEIVPYLSEISMVLLMTVNPGFAGQNFNYDVLNKLDVLHREISRLSHRPLIEVDGNINEKTIPYIEEKGADVYVLGTSQLFNNNKGSYKEKVDRVRKLFI